MVQISKTSTADSHISSSLVFCFCASGVPGPVPNPNPHSSLALLDSRSQRLPAKNLSLSPGCWYPDILRVLSEMPHRQTDCRRWLRTLAMHHNRRGVGWGERRPQHDYRPGEALPDLRFEKHIRWNNKVQDRISFSSCQCLYPSLPNTLGTANRGIMGDKLKMCVPGRRGGQH